MLWKHPRRRGEDALHKQLLYLNSETPPQARGRLCKDLKKVDALRNTPAGAGKTYPSASSLAPHQKHPRRRGEDGSTSSIIKIFGETPPQARGRPFKIRHNGFDYGNTPAGAGKTHRRRCGLVKRRKHPRRRGEDSGWCSSWIGIPETPPQARGRLDRPAEPHRHAGNTPAGAGKTPLIRSSPFTRRKHPRRRGEDAYLNLL